MSFGVCRYDTDWNPQIDLQAQARAHRIGQTNEVQASMSTVKHITIIGLIRSPDYFSSLSRADSALADCTAFNLCYGIFLICCMQVLVLRLQTTNTIEEHIYNVASQKRSVADRSITGGFFDGKTDAQERRAYLLGLLSKRACQSNRWCHYYVLDH